MQVLPDLLLPITFVRLGHAVTVYDALPEAGGVVRFGIPQYRLPKSVLQKEVKFIKKLGVQFQFNQKLGENLSLETLKNECDAVYLASLAWKDIELNIPGEKAKGVFAGTEILKEMALEKTPKLGQQVVIIGAGNVAIDAARSIWRLGKEVTVVYRREKGDMPANASEIFESEAEKISYHFLAAPHEIIADEKGKVKALKVEIMSGGSIDISGRRRPVSTGKYQEIPCDSIIMAVGERVDSEQLANAGWATTTDGRLMVDPFTFQTSGPPTICRWRCRYRPFDGCRGDGHGKKAAAAIDLALMKEIR